MSDQSDQELDQKLDEFLEIRKPGAHLEEGVVADDFVLMLGVDLTNFPKFPRVDDDVTYPKADLDIRHQLDVDSGAELARLQRALPGRPALHRLLQGGPRHQVPAVGRAVPAALRGRVGRPRWPSGTATRRWPRSSGPPGTTRSHPSSSA